MRQLRATDLAQARVMDRAWGKSGHVDHARRPKGKNFCTGARDKEKSVNSYK